MVFNWVKLQKFCECYPEFIFFSIPGVIYPVATRWQWGGGFLVKGFDYGNEIGRVGYIVSLRVSWWWKVFLEKYREMVHRLFLYGLFVKLFLYRVTYRHNKHS